MQRRNFISSVIAVSSIGIAGCSAPKPDTENPTPDAEQVVVNHSFEKVSPDETPDEPAITSIDGKTVTVRGTITVADGCTTIAVGSEPEFTQDGEAVEVMIGTQETGDDMCTQALRDIGFELVFTYEGDAPSTVELAHAGEDSSSHSLSLSEFEESE